MASYVICLQFFSLFLSYNWFMILCSPFDVHILQMLLFFRWLCFQHFRIPFYKSFLLIRQPTELLQAGTKCYNLQHKLYSCLSCFSQSNRGDQWKASNYESMETILMTNFTDNWFLKKWRILACFIFWLISRVEPVRFIDKYTLQGCASHLCFSKEAL